MTNTHWWSRIRIIHIEKWCWLSMTTMTWIKLSNFEKWDCNSTLTDTHSQQRCCCCHVAHTEEIAAGSPSRWDRHVTRAGVCHALSSPPDIRYSIASQALQIGSQSRPAFDKHKEFMVGTRVPVLAFFASATHAVEPLVDYAIKLPTPMYSKKRLVSYCAGG
jgi:hypothetical protein